jgi:hypothetical protein
MHDFFEESIKLENNAANLYKLFHSQFPEDADFWWKLYLEEKNHAVLITSGKEFAAVDEFPNEIFAESVDELKKTNEYLTELAEKFTESPPSRQQAFAAALEVEMSAGELHFQRFMENSGGAWFGDIFRKLNTDDKDHAKRVRAYAKKHDIAIDSK